MADPFTDSKSARSDNRDGTERGVWGKREDVDGAGSILSVRGTGTVDLEVPVVNLGYSFNLPEDSDAEVLMLSIGSDTNNKVALPVIPRSAQYQWPEGTGGMQHPTNADRRIEFNGDETFLRDGTFVVGSNREVTITVDGANVTIVTGGDANLQAGGDMNIVASGTVAITSAALTHNGKDVGDTHTHGGVDVGGSNTAAPN